MLVKPMGTNFRKFDTFSTLEPLNTVLKIFGMSCILRRGVTLKYSYPSFKIFSYIILFLVINSFTIYYKISYLNDRPIVVTFRDFFEMIYLFGFKQYIVDILFIYKYGSKSQLDYISLYDYIDTLLNMPYNMQVRNSIKRFCIFFIIIGSLTIITDCLATTISFGWQMTLMYLIDYLYLLLRMLSVLDVISNCVQISFRLKTIGDVLENFYSNTDNLLSTVKDFIQEELKVKVHRYDITKDVRFNRNILNNMIRSYLLLIEQNEYINTTYGFRVRNLFIYET